MLGSVAQAAQALVLWARRPGRAADAFAAACSGNFDPGSSRAKRAVQLVQRGCLCTGFVSVTVLTTLSGEASITNYVGILQAVLWVQLAWISITVNARYQDPQRMELLQKTLQHRLSESHAMADSGTLLNGCMKLTLVIIIFVLVAVRAIMFAVIPEVGLFLGLASFLPFVTTIFGACDALCKASQWVDASVRALEGFGDDISMALTAGTARHLPTRKVSQHSIAPGAGESVSLAPPSSQPPGPLLSRPAARRPQDVEQLPAITASDFERAYDKAATVVNSMNAIFSGPLTLLLLIFWAMIVLMVIYHKGDTQAARDGVYAGFTVAVLLMIVACLHWLSSVGDTSIRVSRVLLSPHCFLSLSAALNLEDPAHGQMLRESLQSTCLGFEIYNVTMTSQKIIYLVGSIIFGLVFAFAPLLVSSAGP